MLAERSEREIEKFQPENYSSEWEWGKKQRLAEESEAEEEMLHLTKTSESGESKTGESGKKKGKKG